MGSTLTGHDRFNAPEGACDRRAVQQLQLCDGPRVFTGLVSCQLRNCNHTVTAHVNVLEEGDCRGTAVGAVRSRPA